MSQLPGSSTEVGWNLHVLGNANFIEQLRKIRGHDKFDLPLQLLGDRLRLLNTSKPWDCRAKVIDISDYRHLPFLQLAVLYTFV
jgi:hypothetical protein